jgi:hypothetical protein
LDITPVPEGTGWQQIEKLPRLFPEFKVGALIKFFAILFSAALLLALALEPAAARKTHGGHEHGRSSDQEVAIATGAGSLCAIVKQCYQCGVSSRDFSLRI